MTDRFCVCGARVTPRGKTSKQCTMLIIQMESTMKDAIKIQGYCCKCHNWVTPDFLATMRKSAHVSGDVCLNCLADKGWKYLKSHVCTADYSKVARYKIFVEMNGSKHIA